VSTGNVKPGIRLGLWLLLALGGLVVVLALAFSALVLGGECLLRPFALQAMTDSLEEMQYLASDTMADPRTDTRIRELQLRVDDGTASAKDFRNLYRALTVKAELYPDAADRRARGETILAEGMRRFPDDPDLVLAGIPEAETGLLNLARVRPAALREDRFGCERERFDLMENHALMILLMERSRAVREARYARASQQRERLDEQGEAWVKALGELRRLYGERRILPVGDARRAQLSVAIEAQLRLVEEQRAKFEEMARRFSLTVVLPTIEMDSAP